MDPIKFDKLVEEYCSSGKCDIKFYDVCYKYFNFGFVLMSLDIDSCEYLVFENNKLISTIVFSTKNFNKIGDITISKLKFHDNILGNDNDIASDKIYANFSYDNNKKTKILKCNKIETNQLNDIKEIKKSIIINKTFIEFCNLVKLKYEEY